MLQARAVHIIISSLLEKEALSTDPLTVEMKRKGYKSVFPCGRGYPKLNLNQLDWALKEGKWWFNGPIKQLKISKVQKTNLSKADISLFKTMAVNGNFELSMTDLHGNSIGT